MLKSAFVVLGHRAVWEAGYGVLVLVLVCKCAGAHTHVHVHGGQSRMSGV